MLRKFRGWLFADGQPFVFVSAMSVVHVSLVVCPGYTCSGGAGFQPAAPTGKMPVPPSTRRFLEGLLMPWSEISGRELVKRYLARLVRTGRIGGTYLFYGPPGSEQETIAFGFISSILCERRDGDFCGACRSCRRVGMGIHPDVFARGPGEPFCEIEDLRTRRDEDSPKAQREGGTLYKIDHLRAMQGMALLSPMEADWKIFLLRQAEQMQAPAANSLLKILEEPYQHSLFILLTDNITRLLPTIVSRCQRIRLAPLSPEELAKELIAAEGVSRDEAETLARVSGGRLGRARELLGETWRRRRDELLQLIGTLRSGNRLEIVRRSQAWKGDRAVARELLLALLGLLRDGLVLTTVGQPDLLLNTDRTDKMSSIWQGATADEVIAAFEAAVDGLDGLDHNLNVQNVLEGVFTACAGMRP
jgi:DNA polymerase-3 subunit delta'